jgi:hypothetical protein
VVVAVVELKFATVGFGPLDGQRNRVVSTAALAALAKAEAKRAMQPTSSNSCWSHAESAGSFAGSTLRTRTGLGISPVLGAAFEVWLVFHPLRSSIDYCDSAAMSAIAGIVDY